MDAAIRFDRSRRKYVSFFQNTLPILSAREQLVFLNMYVNELATSFSLAHHRQLDAKIVELSAAWVLNGRD